MPLLLGLHVSHAFFFCESAHAGRIDLEQQQMKDVSTGTMSPAQVQQPTTLR
jgi:hypothetical protein